MLDIPTLAVIAIVLMTLALTVAVVLLARRVTALEVQASRRHYIEFNRESLRKAFADAVDAGPAPIAVIKRDTALRVEPQGEYFIVGRADLAPAGGYSGSSRV